MAEFPALPIWTDAYLADTSHLSDAERGRYDLVLFHLWRMPGQRFPNDKEWLARKFGRSVEDIENEWLPLMREFCQCDGNWWTQKRITREYYFVKKQRDAQSVRAKGRWAKEKDISRRNATVGIAPTPTPLVTSETVIAVRDSSDSPVGRTIKKTGTRWAHDAEVPEVWIEEGAGTRSKHHLPMIDLRVEAVAFANYWSAKTGKDATKLDWRKTWINWTLKAEGAKHGNGKSPTANDKFLTGAAALLRKFDTQGRSGEGENPDNAAGAAGRALLPR